MLIKSFGVGFYLSWDSTSNSIPLSDINRLFPSIEAAELFILDFII